jgi:hypothetical protein
MPRKCPGVGNQSKQQRDGLDVGVGVAAQSAPGRRVQVGGLDDDEMEAVGRNELVASRVVDGSLTSAVDSAHGQSLGFVEEGVGSIVLEFSVLDDEVSMGPVSVHRKASTLSVAAWVA